MSRRKLRASDPTLVSSLDALRKCGASCRAASAYACDRGMDIELIKKLDFCVEQCGLALRAMDSGNAEMCEEICEAAAAACHGCGEACGAIADDAQMALCAAACAVCEKACLAMDTDGDMDDEPQFQMSDEGPRYFVRLGEVGRGVKRVPIAMLGSFVKGKIKFSITKKTLSDIVTNFKKRAADTVIDYEHASEDPRLAAGQPIPAAGWIQELDEQPDANGVLWGEADFTDRARTMLAAKEIKYFSPVIDWGARDKHTGEPQGATLTSGALTLRPFLDGMPAIAMNEGWRRIDRGDAAIEGGKVKVTKLILADRAAGMVRVLLEGGEEVTAALEGLEKQPKVVRLSDVKRDKEGKYDFASLPQDEGVLIASDVFRGMQVQSALDEAMKAGKITAAQRPTYEKLALNDLAGFRTLMETQKVVVDLGERGTGAEGLKGAAQVQAAIDAKVAEVRKAKPSLGYSQALKLVASENADLFALKNKLQGGR